MEPQWNPMAEEQALDRCHRLCQTRKGKAIRYVVKDWIEKASITPGQNVEIVAKYV
jgi:SNF2 family DNA or RNA helicase